MSRFPPTVLGSIEVSSCRAYFPAQDGGVRPSTRTSFEPRTISLGSPAADRARGPGPGGPPAPRGARAVRGRRFRHRLRAAPGDGGRRPGRAHRHRVRVAARALSLDAGGNFETLRRRVWAKRESTDANMVRILAAHRGESHGARADGGGLPRGPRCGPLYLRPSFSLERLGMETNAFSHPEAAAGLRRLGGTQRRRLAAVPAGALVSTTFSADAHWYAEHAGARPSSTRGRWCWARAGSRRVASHPRRRNRRASYRGRAHAQRPSRRRRVDPHEAHRLGPEGRTRDRPARHPRPREPPPPRAGIPDRAGHHAPGAAARRRPARRRQRPRAGHPHVPLRHRQEHPRRPPGPPALEPPAETIPTPNHTNICGADYYAATTQEEDPC